MNIYACLDDSDDDVPVVKAVAKKEEKVAPKKDAKAPVKKDEAAKPAAANVSAGKPKADKKENAPTNNGTPRVPAAASAARENGEFKKDDNRSRSKKDGSQNRTERRDRQERHRDEPAASGRDDKPQTRAKREFDRRPSSNRTGGQSKGGSGAHGFGNEKEEALLAEKNPELVAAELDTAVDETAAQDEAALAEEAAVPQAEPEPATLTYEEYLAKRNESRANSEAFGAVNKLRQVDASEFQGLKTKKEEETVFIKISVGEKAKKEATTSATVAKKEQRSTAKSAVEVSFKSAPTYEPEDRPRREFNGAREQGGGRGGRGEGRGGRGREGGRGDAGRGSGGYRKDGRGASININDADSFPAL